MVTTELLLHTHDLSHGIWFLRRVRSSRERDAKERKNRQLSSLSAFPLSLSDAATPPIMTTTSTTSFPWQLTTVYDPSGSPVTYRVLPSFTWPSSDDTSTYSRLTLRTWTPESSASSTSESATESGPITKPTPTESQSSIADALNLPPECSPTWDGLSGADVKCPSNCPTAYITTSIDGSPITWCSGSPLSTSVSSSGLSSGAKAGIAVGASAGALFVAGIIFFVLRRQRKQPHDDENEFSELGGKVRYEIGGEAKPAELCDTRKFELYGEETPAELDSDEFSKSQMQSPRESCPEDDVSTKVSSEDQSELPKSEASTPSLPATLVSPVSETLQVPETVSEVSSK
ncbi:hypothetical protein EX30DRAFT_341463 [Ascodesmis nigricans]|uniref:Uncharacterized protein n=1 Tax=Ascodesmis nigricans TaxID=341454 RepID=A0A4S2MVC7_9PEZI|nr:hypothetical protein EX30DRAFT_341463 [Ascodesmis nigricans]